MGDELARKGRWIALLNQQTGQGRRVRLYLKVRPLLISLGGLMVAGYLASAVALVWWLDRSPFNKVGFADVAMPWRWSALNTLRGEGFSERGMKEIQEEGQELRAVFYLQRGLGLKPDHAEARLTLAKFYEEAKYYPGVKRTIMPQLKFGYSRPLVELLLKAAAQADDLTTVQEVANAMRELVLDQADQKSWLDEWRTQTFIRQDEPEAALKIIEENGYELGDWSVMKVNALIGLGDLDRALEAAQAIPPAFPGMFPLGLRTQARVLSERKERDALLAVLDLLFEDSKHSQEPWIFAIEQLVKAEFYAEASNFIGDFMLRFGANSGAVNTLYTRVVNTGSLPATQMAFDKISEWGEPTTGQRLALAWMLISEGEWSRLQAEFGQGLGDEKTDGFVIPLVRGLGEATADSTATEGLNAFLGKRGMHLQLYKFLIRGLSKSEHWPLVQMVAQAGKRYHPDSVSMDGYLVQSAEKLAEMEPKEERGDLAASVRKTYEESDVPALKLELTRAMEGERWSDIESLVLEIRRQRAAWFSQIEPTVDLADARAGAARGDLERLTRLAPAVLRRDRGEMEWFLDQAELAMERGESKRVLRLVEAILSVERINYRAHQMWKKLIAPVESDNAEATIDGGGGTVTNPEP